MQEKRCIDKSDIVQPQGFLNFFLGGTLVMFGQNLPTAFFPGVGVQDHKFKLAAIGACDAADNPVRL